MPSVVVVEKGRSMPSSSKKTGLEYGPSGRSAVTTICLRHTAPPIVRRYVAQM